MRYTFEAYKEDGSPRKYVGMRRPPMIQPTGYVLCICGSILQTQQMLVEHYGMGHFDSPLYEDEE